mgnify:FL=1
MNTILDQGILGHPTSQRTYWSSSVNMNAARPVPASRSHAHGDFGKSVSAIWSSLTKG